MLLLLTSESENDRPLWIERAAARWTQRRSSSSVVFAALVAILLVGAMDGVVAGLAGFDFVATVFYIAPISFAAWGAGARTGLVVAIFAAVVEAAATWWGRTAGFSRGSSRSASGWNSSCSWARRSHSPGFAGTWSATASSPEPIP
jgi:hypothetical protein